MLAYDPTGKCLNGERFRTLAPDTLDLADRMALAINALTNVWYPEEQWGQGFLTDFSQRPPVIFPSHITDAYLNIPPKFIEALVFCRAGSGSGLNLAVDTEVLKTQLSLLGDDGLTYCPGGTFLQFSEERGFSEIWGEGRMLSALSTLVQVDPNPQWVAMGSKKVDRLLALSRQKEDFRFFWKGRFRPGEQVPTDADEPSVPNSHGSLADYDPLFSKVYSIGALGHGAGLFYRVTGYEPALELSRGLAHWGLKRIFNQPGGRYDFWHFHHGLYSLMAVWEYALAAGDRAVMEQVNASYRWARQMGDASIGFFTELFPDQRSWQYINWTGKTVEICELADIIWLALNLTRAGVDDYWDDVDRWVRNVFAEGQLCSLEDFKHIPESYFNSNPPVRPHQDSTRILDRSLGSFLGWIRANDGLKVAMTDQGKKLANVAIQHCCTANGARNLYHVWDSIITREGSLLKVNLLLNRASVELDVASFLPALGAVELAIKNAPRVAVRIPEGCKPEEMQVTVSGDNRNAVSQGRYLLLEGLRPGDLVRITFPLVERSVTRVIGDLPFTLKFRGANLVDIDPHGEALPLYVRLPEGKLVEKERFLAGVRPLIW
jgi:hypothetical protein